MKYLKLSEIRTKYWSQMTGPRFNYSDILIAFEVSSKLTVMPVNKLSDFDKVWASEMEVAKDIIRDIHSELVGFNPHNVLEMTRRLHQFRLVDTRVPSSPFYWDMQSAVIDGVEPIEGMLDEDVEEAKAFARRLINVKSLSINGFVDSRSNRSYEDLMADLVDEADVQLSKMDTPKTSTQINRMFTYVERVLIHCVDLVSLANTLELSKHHGPTVDTFLATSLKAMTNELLNEQVMLDAIKELEE